ncbi:MAG TPA: outer membrane beta-barrel protein [Gammaproteobacteria bacterium]|nr:outer membrane beta-barrel protein [Gammaproteobacteria bacterium]
MFKKLFVASAVFITSSSFALAAAGAPYLGASLGVVDNTSTNNNFRGMPLTVSAGYGATVSQSLYLAGELFGVIGTANLDNNAMMGSVKTTYGYGASFIPGVMLSDHTMTYARVGVVKSRFTNFNKTVTGGQLGLGLQTSITQNWDLRGEYDYTAYNKFSGISTKADAFNMGLVYKFE